MPKLIVKLNAQRSQVFELPSGVTLIGRGDHCDLVLPNTSVSREHTRITVTGLRATLDDLDSQNKTFVNGKPVTKAELARRDEIQIGRFSLIYLPGGDLDRFWKGRLVSYLPPYQLATLVPDQGATFRLRQEAMEMLQRNARAVENARLISQSDPEQFWFPEEGGLTLGPGGDIPASWPLSWGVLAELRWKGGQHVLTRKSWVAPVQVNGEPCAERALQNGDHVRVGRSHFLYERPQ